MKKTLILIFFAMVSVAAYAQPQPEPAKKEPAKKEETKKDAGIKEELKKVDSRDRFVIELAHDNWLNTPDGLKTRWFNRGFNFHFMYDIPIGKSKNVSIAPGIGLSNANVYHNSFLNTTADTAYFTTIPDSIDYKKGKTKLATTFLDIPIELRFRTNPNEKGKSFKVALGFRVGYLLSASSKYQGDDIWFNTGETTRVKQKRLPSINKFKYGPTFRIGYGSINLWGYYSLGTLFQADKGPGIQPFSVGVSFNSF